MTVVLGLVSVVAEVNTGCGCGVITEVGVISGISYRFVSPMLLFERALIIITTTTHMITVTVIDTVAVVAVVAVVMVFIVGVFVVVVLVVVVAKLVMVAVVVHNVDDIDPGERVNMWSFFAFEFTQ